MCNSNYASQTHGIFQNYVYKLFRISKLGYFAKATHFYQALDMVNHPT